MTAQLTSFVKGLFGSQEHADCDVRFYLGNNHGAPVTEVSDAWLSDKIPGHLLILAANSERLNAQADNPWWPQVQVVTVHNDQPETPPLKKARYSQRLAGTGSSAPAAAPVSASAPPPPPLPGRPLLAVPLDGPHEVEPAVSVLKFMYQGLEPGLSPQQLLMTRKLALYLLNVECAEACAAALAAAPPLSAEDAHAACTNQHVACMLDDQAVLPFTSACAIALARQFRNTLEVARSEELTSLFVILPLAIVQQLLEPDGSGKLAIDCEDTVLLLLHRWANGNTLGPVRARQLRKLLLPLRLSASYLHDVLPALDWLELTARDLADLAFAKHALQAAHRMNVANAKKNLLTSRAIFKDEPQWLEERSSSPNAAAAAVRVSSSVTAMTASFTREELHAIQEKARRESEASVAGPYVYWRGFEWCVDVNVVVTTDAAAAGDNGNGCGSAQQATAGLFLCNFLPDAFRDLEDSATAYLSHYMLEADRAGGRAPEYAEDKEYMVASERGRGVRNFFTDGRGLDPALWEPYLVNGIMTVRAVLTV